MIEDDDLGANFPDYECSPEQKFEDDIDKLIKLHNIVPKEAAMILLRIAKNKLDKLLNLSAFW